MKRCGCVTPAHATDSGLSQQSPLLARRKKEQKRREKKKNRGRLFVHKLKSNVAGGCVSRGSACVRESKRLLLFAVKGRGLLLSVAPVTCPRFFFCLPSQTTASVNKTREKKMDSGSLAASASRQS